MGVKSLEREREVVTFVTWFHADDQDRAGSYSQIRGSAASAGVRETYLRCVDVAVASFRRWNAVGRCVVVVNPAAVKHLVPERRGFWRRLGVELLIVENEHRPDVDLFAEWQNQFFLFDVIRAAVGDDRSTDGAVVVVDSDVLVRSDLGDLAGAVVSAGTMAMRIPYPEDELANGSTRSELGRYVEEISGTALGFVPAYQGGEFVSGTPRALHELVASCERVYRWSLERRRSGRGHPHEEAQIISMAAPVTDASAAVGNRYVERIWTKPWNLRLVPDAPRALALWHLPAEKRTGIARLHGVVAASSSWFWTASDEEWLHRVERAVGVPVYGPFNLLRDLVVLRADVLPAVRERLERRLPTGWAIRARGGSDRAARTTSRRS